jgi:O-acetylserine/cysteine efflux transporter
MRTDRRLAVIALALAGLLWGTTVPLSKIALEWLPPGWLTFTRFALAAVILIAVTPKARLRAAFTPTVLIAGAAGYGGTVVVQNVGITRTSVTHAALLIGAVPVLVAIIAAIWQRAVAAPVAWMGFVISLAGVGLIAGGHGDGATMSGDVLVLISVVMSAVFTVGQGRLLRDRDPMAVTAVQFVGAALGSLAFAAVTEGAPPAPSGLSPVVTVVVLAVAGTLVPFTLFAFGQSRVSAEAAGAFLNLEPLVGAVAGVAIFGNPAGPVQAAGGAAILGGIALSSLPLLHPSRPTAAPAAQTTAGPAVDQALPAGQVPASAGQTAALAGQVPALGGEVTAELGVGQPAVAELVLAQQAAAPSAADAQPGEGQAGADPRTWPAHAHPGDRTRRLRALPHRPGRARAGRPGRKSGRAATDRPRSGRSGRDGQEARRPGLNAAGLTPQNVTGEGTGRPVPDRPGGGRPGTIRPEPGRPGPGRPTPSRPDRLAARRTRALTRRPGR